MAINNTGAMFKSFEFDGTDSRDFGVYITGSGVYDAPEREVEMISIPNRNGAFALDKGRFENIEVTYPAGIYADTEADFAEGISDLRNFLCSKRGYCRLTDEYNPNEYRMAIYKSGLEVEPALLKAGEFEITFECMPQRFLTSGETEQTITSGGTITNPTLFKANPLIKVNGYGDIDFNGYPISIDNVPLGYIVLNQSESNVESFTFDSSLVNNGDPITLSNIDTVISESFNYDIYNAALSSSSVSTTSATCSGYDIKDVIDASRRDMHYNVAINSVSFTVGTYGSVSLSFAESVLESAFIAHTRNYALYISYDGTSTITFRKLVNSVTTPCKTNYNELSAVSSISALGNPTYIDCDTGTCYMIVNGRYIPLNHVIDLGSNLPVLDSGSNTVSYDNTITSFKVVPRWWQV